MARRTDPALRELLPSDVDLRDAFFDQLHAIASSDRDVLVLTDDQGAFGVERIRREMPAQYFNVGIAEQNLVSVAAGLALGGKRPFIYGISTFMTMRSYEQIKDDICCLNLPVTIVGSGAGYTYSGDGPTHHGLYDVGVMRTLPEMTILSPSDAVLSSYAARAGYESGGPVYVRIEKGTLPAIHDPQDDFSAGYVTLGGGTDVVLIASGWMVHRAVEVAQALILRGIDAGVIDLFRAKPVSGPALLDAVGSAPHVATVEEHSLVGGVGTIVAELLADLGSTVRLRRFGTADAHVYEYGTREWLIEREGLGTAAITERIAEWLGVRPA